MACFKVYTYYDIIMMFDLTVCEFYDQPWPLSLLQRDQTAELRVYQQSLDQPFNVWVRRLYMILINNW